MFNPDIIQAISGFVSTLIALVALVLTFRVERRNQERFDEQLRESRELAQATIRPLLTISSQVYKDLKSVRLINRGIGTAVITKVEFSRGEQKTTNLVDLFNIQGRFYWQTFRRFSGGRTFISPNETIDLIR